MKAKKELSKRETNYISFRDIEMCQKYNFYQFNTYEKVLRSTNTEIRLSYHKPESRLAMHNSRNHCLRIKKNF